MILILLLDKMSFLLKLATGPYPQVFSSTPQGLRKHTFSKTLSYLCIISQLSLSCATIPFWVTPLPYLHSVVHSLHYWGGAVVLQLCLLKRSEGTMACAFSRWAMLLTSIPSVWQVHGILSHSLQCQHRLHVWEECQLLWHRGGTKTWCSPAASSQNHYCSYQPCWPSLFMVSGNFPALCWG